ncbi:MAG: hypothetical protein ACJAY8_001577, partial [Sphingobacteriales bacterium]
MLVGAFTFGVWGYFQAVKLTDKYSLGAEVLVKNRQANVRTDKQLGGQGIYEFYADLANQERLIRSYDFLSKVIRKLEMEAQYFHETSFGKTELFELPFKMEVKPMVGLQEIELYQEGDDWFLQRSGDEENRVLVSWGTSMDLYNHSYLLEKEEVQLPEGKFRIIPRDNNHWIIKYLNALSVRNLEYTSIFALDVRDEVIDRGRIFLDSLCEELITYNLDQELLVNKRTIEFIDAQLDQVTDIINSIEVEIQQINQKSPIVRLKSYESRSLEKLFLLDMELEEIRIDQDKIDGLLKYVELLQTERDGVVPPAGNLMGDDLFVAQSVDGLFDNFKERRSWVATRGRNHSGYKNLLAQYELLKLDFEHYLFEVK